jgi:hypothetical protein
MKKRMLGTFLLLGLVAGIVAVPSPAGALQHLMYIDEVFGGVGYAPGADFIELRMYSGNQGSVDDHVVTTYSADGNLLDTATFTSNVANEQQGDSILIATDEAENLFQVTADLPVNTLNIPTDGRACFGPSTTSHFDCVTWGDYAGPSPQSPINNPEGMIAGASFRRVYGTNGIDGSDDHDNNVRDFLINTPDPRNNNDDSFNASQRIKFGPSSINVSEVELQVDVPVTRLGDTTGAVDFLFSMVPGTAEGTDFNDASGIKTFGTGQNGFDIDVTFPDNSIFEGPETINLTMRGPTSPAFLAMPVNSRIILTDFEDDEEPPTSEITKPEHRGTYGRSNLGSIRGTSDDGVGVVDVVKVALRQTRTDGSCKWFNGNRFVSRSCSNKLFVEDNAAADGDWNLNLGDPLAKSVGTNVKFYTAYSRATDSGVPSNTEVGFETGRNSNRFEIN